MMPGPQFRNAAPAIPDNAGMGLFLATPIPAPISIIVMDKPVPKGPCAHDKTVSRKDLKVLSLEALAAIAAAEPIMVTSATETREKVLFTTNRPTLR